MKRALFTLAASLCLVACAGTTSAPGTASTLPIPPAPGSIASQTKLDESAALGVELAYKAARVALETATDAGFIKGARATQIAAIDNRAYALVKAVRAAYRAGNASGYFEAVKEARAAIDETLTAIWGR